MATSVSSPFCTWLVAACMFMGRENDHSTRLSIRQSPKRCIHRSRNKKMVVQRRKNGDGDCCFSSSSSMYSLLTSCLEPCLEFYNSNGFSSSLAYFGTDNFLQLFGTKIAATFSKRKRHKNIAAGLSSSHTAVAVKPEKKNTVKKKPVGNQRRVVVTGLSVVTSIGEDADVFYNNLLDGNSGISEIEAFDCAQFPTRIAGEIKSFSTDGWVKPKLSKRADKFMLYLLTAGKKALVDGGITEEAMDDLDKTRCGIIIGSALGGMGIINDGIKALRVSYKKMNPFSVPFATTNIGSAMLAMDLGWMGPNYSISSACATSNFCILNAANHITRGETDLMLCGGSDAAIIPIGLGGFVACRALSQRNNEPSKASRPWDKDRDGFVLGEGSGVLLLEELEHAKRRGARIYAEFLGGSSTCDAYHMTEPHPDGMGMALCMERALAQCGVSREEVNYINAHATSTQTGDLTEYHALIRCFGRNPKLRVNSTKSMIGHLLGAAGAVEAVATVKAIQTRWIHPNLNLENPDKILDTSFLVGGHKERLEVKVALSNSFGFGGHNSSILFAPYKE